MRNKKERRQRDSPSYEISGALRRRSPTSPLVGVFCYFGGGCFTRNNWKQGAMVPIGAGCSRKRRGRSHSRLRPG
jgi:hypothetical protein